MKKSRPLGGSAALSRSSRTAARALPRGRRRRGQRLRAAGTDPVPRHPAARHQAARQRADRQIRLVRRGGGGAAGPARRGQGHGRSRHHRTQGGARGGEPAGARPGAEAAGIVVVVERARLLPHRHGLRRKGAVPRSAKNLNHSDS